MLKGQMPLWTFVNMLAKSLFHSFYALQIIQSATINTAVCYIVSKYTHRYFLFLLVYFFTLHYFVLNTEVMREGFAIAFALIGMHNWMSGRKWLFFLMFLIALLFHISTVTLLLFPFVRFPISWKTLPIAFFAAFCIWLFSDLVLGKVMMAVLGGMGAMVEKVLFYSLHASTIFGFLRSALTFLVFPFIIMYTALNYEPSETLRERKEKMISYMLVLGILSASLAGFSRVYNYTRVFYLIMLADFIYITFHQQRHFIFRTGIIACTAFFISLNYLIYFKTTKQYFYQFYYPYTCILNEDRSVYLREITHFESTSVEDQEKNVRKLE
jgi:hypothetical protein